MQRCYHLHSKIGQNVCIYMKDSFSFIFFIEYPYDDVPFLYGSRSNFQEILHNLHRLSEENVSINSPEIFSFGSIGIIWLEHDSSSVAAVLRDRRREKHIARQSSFSGRRADALTNQKQIS